MRAEFLLFASVVLALCFLCTAAIVQDEAVLLVLAVGSFVLLVAVGLFKRIQVRVTPRVAISALISMQVLLILLPLGLCALVLLGKLGGFRITGALVASGVVLVAQTSMYIWYRRLVLDSVKDEK